MFESKEKEKELREIKGDIHHVKERSAELEKTYGILSMFQSNDTLRQFQELVAMNIDYNKDEDQEKLALVLDDSLSTVLPENTPSLSAFNTFSTEIHKFDVKKDDSINISPSLSFLKPDADEEEDLDEDLKKTSLQHVLNDPLSTIVSPDYTPAKSALSILNSFSKEIPEYEVTAALIKSKEEENIADTYTSRTMTFKSEQSQSSSFAPEYKINMDKKKGYLNYNVNTINEEHHHHHHHYHHKEYESSNTSLNTGLESISKAKKKLFRNNAMKRNKSGAYNIYYRNFMKPQSKHHASIDTDYSPSTKQTGTTSWDKVTLNNGIYNNNNNDDDNSSIDVHNILSDGYKMSEDSYKITEDILNNRNESEYYTESAKRKSKMISNPFESTNNDNESIKPCPLPSGWSRTYTSSGMLIYLDHINKIATFHHPLHDSWSGSLRSVAATFDSRSHDQKRPI